MNSFSEHLNHIYITETMKLSRYIFTVIVLFILWMLLTNTFKGAEVLVGGICSFLIALFTYAAFSKTGLVNLHPKKIFWLIVYIPYFLWEMAKANIDVAYRVINPRLPIKPGIVMVKTKMKSDAGKIMVANSITLTPGTLTLDIIDDKMFIHWIWVQSADVEEASKLIPGKFEKILMRAFK